MANEYDFYVRNFQYHWTYKKCYDVQCRWQTEPKLNVPIGTSQFILCEWCHSDIAYRCQVFEDTVYTWRIFFCTLELLFLTLLLPLVDNILELNVVTLTSYFVLSSAPLKVLLKSECMSDLGGCQGLFCPTNTGKRGSCNTFRPMGTERWKWLCGSICPPVLMQ